ncbi:MAG: DUF3943 domain-containing protein [Rhodothermales bacterium]
MRLKIAFVTLLLFSTGPRHELAAQQRPTDECLVCDGKKSVALAGVEVMSINTLVWAFNRFVTKVDHGYVTLESWKRNLREGFEWDPNHFSTNQLQHPYHGAAYFTAARSRGFSFWESVPFVIFGSLTWEYFGEPVRPSINDFITTSLGGAALGEITYRFSSMVLDNTATGSERTKREIAGFLISPIRGINRFLSGRTSRVYANPSGQTPSHLSSEMTIGYRRLGEGRSLGGGDDQVFVDFNFIYGALYEEEIEAPFDFFIFGLSLNYPEKKLVGRAQVQGSLVVGDLHRSDKSILMISAFQHFDYFNSEAYEFGGQSFSASLLYRRQLGGRWVLHSALHLNGLVLGATSSDYTEGNRDYDFGSGFGFKFLAAFERAEREILTFRSGSFWLHTLNGSDEDHLVHMAQLKLNVPVTHRVSLGADLVVYERTSYVDVIGDLTQRNPQVRVFLSWRLDR